MEFEPRRGDGAETSLRLSLVDGGRTAEVAFPYFGGAATNGFTATAHPDVVNSHRAHAQPRAKRGRDGGGDGL